MEDIRDDLTSLETRLRATDTPRSASLILKKIDDLDRCEPEKAVEVLQAVNLLLNFKSFIVLPGDRRADRHRRGREALRRPARGTPAPRVREPRQDGPDPVPDPGADLRRGDHLPRRSARQPGGGPTPPSPEGASRRGERSRPREPPGHGGGTPWAARTRSERQQPQRLGRRLSSGAGDSVPDAAAPAEPRSRSRTSERLAFVVFAKHLRPNPRHLKRVVNVYRLVRALAGAEKEQLILKAPASATIRWLVMWSQWPYASLAMIERFDAQLDDWKGEIPEDQREVDALPLLARARRADARRADPRSPRRRRAGAARPAVGAGLRADVGRDPPHPPLHRELQPCRSRRLRAPAFGAIPRSEASWRSAWARHQS